MIFSNPQSQSLKAGKALAVLVTAASLPFIADAQSVLVEGEDLPESVRREIDAALVDFSPAETTLGARRLAQRAAGLAGTVLNANGYFAPSLTTRVDVGPPPRPVLTIAPGPRFAVDAINVDYGESPPDDDAALAVERALTISPGVAAIPSKVIAQEGIIRLALQRSGYPDAAVLGRDSRGNRDAGTIDVRYRVRSGPPVLLGNVSFEASDRVKESYLDRFLTFPPGTPYAPDELDTLKRRLTQDRLFQSVQVRLEDSPARIAPSGAEVRDVTVRLTERPRNRVAAGVGFATNEGAGIALEYERRDLSQRADSVTAELALADLRRSLQVTWDRPHEFGFGRDLQLSALASDDTTDSFDRRLAALSALVEQTISPNFAYTLGVTGEVLQEDLIIDRNTNETETRDVQTLGFLGGARLDRVDDTLDPKRGWRINATAEPSVSQGDISNQVLKLSGQVRGYRPIGVNERVVAALRLRAGSVIGASFLDVTTEKRFFGGGGGSVRGYEFQSIGAVSEDGTPLGGLSLLETSAELRWQARDKLGFVAFLDAGRVTDQPGLAFDDMRFGTGLGLRYQTVAGPIRFDIGTPIDPRPGDDPVHIYLSVGQAF